MSELNKPPIGKEPSFEDVTKFFEWLQGKKLDNFNLEFQPQLTPEQAFTIIYVMQEGLGVLPDNIEMCCQCKELYDSNSEGSAIDEDTLTEDERHFDEADFGNYCESCRLI
jgi:hypothetical protein